MASGKYVKGMQKLLEGSIALLTDDIRVVCVDAADYTVNLSTHDFLDDIAGAGRVASSAAMASKTTTDGVFDAADVAISSVSGDTFEALVVYKHTGVDSTAPLLVYIDTATSGLPLVPNGGTVNILWDNGANRIFAI